MKGVCFLLLALAVTINAQQLAMFGPEFATEPTIHRTREDLLFLDPTPVTPEPVNPTDPTTPATPATPAASAAAPAKSLTDNLLGALSSLTNNWTKITQNFKTSRSNTVINTIKGKGYTSFSQSAQVQISKGIKDEYFDKYLESLGKRIKIPSERQEDLNEVLGTSRFMDSSVWSAFNTLFSLANGGETKFVTVLIGRDDVKNTFDVVFTDIKATFQLAPDVMVIQKKLSVLGGIWEDEKTENVSVPRSLTQEDISDVISFFQVIAFKTIADQFGYKVEFPKIQ